MNYFHVKRTSRSFILTVNGVIKESPTDTRVRPTHDNNARMKAPIVEI